MDLWSQMPKDLLQQIAGYLDTQFDLVRFRSVCSSWRSSIPPNPINYLHRRFSVLPNIGISETAWGFYLSKRAIFLIGPPQSCDQTPWLIKLGQGKSQRLTLLNPIVRHPFLTLPDNFPKNLDLLNLRVLELGQEHVLQYMNFRHFRTTFGDPSALYLEKVAFLNRGCGSDFYEGKDYVLLTIHVSGKLALFRSGDKEWSIIHDMPSPYDDVIMFNGSFYAVDSNGRIVIVGLDLSTSLVADAVLGGDKKYLVESMGELLLVDTYLSIDIEGEDQDEVEFRAEDMLGRCMSERTLRFKVYKLDREGNKWNEVRDLGDRVLFLGDDSTFSASFRDLGLCKGNFIFFADNVFQLNPVDDDMLEGHDVGVFDMESGSIGSLDNHPRYSKLFWPPPDWIFASRISEVNNQLESLRL